MSNMPWQFISDVVGAAEVLVVGAGVVDEVWAVVVEVRYVVVV